MQSFSLDQNQDGALQSQPTVTNLQEVQTQLDFEQIQQKLIKIDLRDEAGREGSLGTQKLINRNLIKIKLKLKLHFKLITTQSQSQIDATLKDFITKIKTSEAITLLKAANVPTQRAVKALLIANMRNISSKLLDLLAQDERDDEQQDELKNLQKYLTHIFKILQSLRRK